MLAVLHETSRWCCLTNNSCCGLRQTRNEHQQERPNRHFRFPSRWIKNANTQKPIPTAQSWTSVSGRPGGVLHAPIFASLSGAHSLCVHPDVHALYETVWGFLDTIPDITPVKVRHSPPASSSDYLTAGSGLQWLIPRQSLRLVQHREKECIQRPDDENKNTCWGSRPPKKGMSSPGPAMLVTIPLTLLVRVVTLRLNLNSSQSRQNIPRLVQRRHRISEPGQPPPCNHRPARSCAD